MTEEPYRWLEAIQNRREYIEDQLTPGLPVVALSAEPGILLLGIKSSTPKLFEIYDNLALGTIGHPADIEKVRQTAIDAAHLEGFARSAQDVSARRLVSYNLAPALKAAFEQIFSAPLLFRGVLAELGATAGEDALWSVDYDGSFNAQSGAELSHGMVISGPRQVAKDWTAQTPKAALETRFAQVGRPFRVAPARLGQIARDERSRHRVCRNTNRGGAAQGETWHRRTGVRAARSHVARPTDFLSPTDRRRVGPVTKNAIFTPPWKDWPK